MRKVLPLLLALAGLWGILDGIYIHAKAGAAQLLLEEAWEDVQQGKDQAKPWPWADTSPLARLTVPELKINQIVLSGASGRVLAFGPGHVSGTAPPGRPGNTVLSGHRDTHFSWLREVDHGTVVQLALPAGELVNYQVVDRSVHHETETRLLMPTEHAQLRLITCYPFDSVQPGGPLRYVVTARQVKM